jgi:hypothetical protein
MRNKMIIPIAVSMFVTVSCESQSKEPASRTNSKESVLTRQFFDWYISEVRENGNSYYHVPPYQKINDTSYIFDIKEFEKRLKKITFFALAFRKTLVAKLEGCNSEMKKVKWDSEPESQFSIKTCDYLWGDNWVGGQGEEISGYEIIGETAEGDAQLVTVQIFVGGKPYAKSQVLVAKEADKYKIFDIRLDWTK